MAFTAQTFLAQIEAHLAQTRTSATAFGQAAVGDPCFVFDLRSGRMPSLRLVERVHRYIGIGESEPAAALEREGAAS